MKEHSKTRHIKVNMGGIWSENKGKQSQIEVIQILMKVGGMQYNVILCEMRVLCKYK